MTQKAGGVPSLVTCENKPAISWGAEARRFGVQPVDGGARGVMKSAPEYSPRELHRHYPTGSLSTDLLPALAKARHQLFPQTGVN